MHVFVCVLRDQVVCLVFVGCRHVLTMPNNVPRGGGAFRWRPGQCGPIFGVLVRPLLMCVTRVFVDLL